ncbi:unnamed protein product [Caenorhabditis nigoni]
MPPPGLHSLIVYDNFEWKTAQKSHENYQNICDLLKIPVISLEEYETEFYGILKEIYHPKLIFRNLAKIDNLKLGIISDVLAGKSIEKSYEDLSETFGAENIDDLNFFWNYRFYHRCYDLDHDQKLDPERKDFLNLPIEIHHKILENLDVKSRFTIRKVSRSLRDIIDSQRVDYSYMSIDFGKKSIRLKLNDFRLNYSENKNFQKMALKDLEIVLKSAKTVDLFVVHFEGSSSKFQFESFLKAMENTTFDVKQTFIQVKRSGEALKILSHFKPGKLEYISSKSFDKNGNLNNLVEMEQFKKAKELYIEEYGIPDFSLIDRFFGFKKFVVRLDDIQTKEVILVQTALEKLPNDRHWTFYSDNLVCWNVEQAIDPSRIIELDDQDFLTFYETKIPNSEDYISFVLVEWDHHFTMKKHQ